MASFRCADALVGDRRTTRRALAKFLAMISSRKRPTVASAASRAEPFAHSLDVDAYALLRREGLLGGHCSPRLVIMRDATKLVLTDPLCTLCARSAMMFSAVSCGIRRPALRRC